MAVVATALVVAVAVVRDSVVLLLVLVRPLAQPRKFKRV